MDDVNTQINVQVSPDCACGHNMYRHHKLSEGCRDCGCVEFDQRPRLSDSPRRKWLSWQSRIMPIWLWHAMFDGTPLCNCDHSKEYRRVR